MRARVVLKRVTGRVLKLHGRLPPVTILTPGTLTGTDRILKATTTRRHYLPPNAGTLGACIIGGR